MQSIGLRRPTDLVLLKTMKNDHFSKMFILPWIGNGSARKSLMAVALSNLALGLLSPSVGRVPSGFMDHLRWCIITFPPRNCCFLLYSCDLEL